MIPILSGNVASATAASYDIDYSCRFRYDGDDRMDRTIESPTLGTKWTFSTWLKRDNLGDYHHILTSTDNPGNWDSIRISNGDKFQVLLNNESINLTTTAVYRDMSAWYSFIVAYDSTQGTASNRVKLYVNGTQVTAFDTSNYPSENYIPNFQVSGETLRIGANTWSIGTGHEKLGGYIAETFFIDGVAHAPTDFGEFDSDSPTIWKPKDCSGDFTYGTNGFYLDFADSGDLGDDESGNGNDFTETNLTATDQSTDTPTNNFCTFNPLFGAETQAVNTTFSEGNLAVVNSGSIYNPYGTTIGVNKGKWYAEFKANANMGDGNIGIFAKLGASSDALSSQTQQYSWYFTASAGNIRSGGSNIVTSVGTIAANDIIGIALDCDNNKLYFHKNGTYISNGTGTGNPSSGTNGISITDPDDTDLGVYFMTAMDWGGSTRGNWFANFGSPSFAISSGNADGNGYGNMEYAIPSNFLTLCTKNLGSDGG